ncbi:MAG: ABC transporter permease [Clostridia bacterium]|nr:ABC transporter permease [Clostridia bacterium]
MKTTVTLIKRNIKLFFADKGLFFTSLITPAILLLLYVTFLENVYRDSFTSILCDGFGFSISEEIISGFVGGQLISSLLAVTCVTVSFCSNMLMVQDKITGMTSDMLVTPVKKHIPPISYYVATVAVTFFISLIAVAGGFVYIAAIGWYLSFTDVLLILLDVFLLVMFGTALSSVINFFLSSQGQISAVGSIVSSCYGFICGAYMPISQFPEWLQKVIAFLPGTYGTSLLREHAIRGSLSAMSEAGVSAEAVDAMRDAVDCNIYFFENKVETWQSYFFLCVTVVLLIGAYVALNFVKKKGKTK